MLATDVRFAVRTLRKDPSFSLVALVALALGIGANTAIFSVVQAVLLRPLPYPSPAELVQLNERGLTGTVSSISAPNFRDWKARNRTFDAMAAYTTASLTVTGVGDPRQVPTGFVDPDLFRVLGVTPALGRAFTAADAQFGAPHLAVLTDGLWRAQFGADPGVIGRTVSLDAVPHEIVGVMPPGFGFPADAQVLVPLVFSPRQLEDQQRGAHYLDAIGRLAPGATVAQASDDLGAIEAALAKQFKPVEGYSVAVEPMLDSMTSGVRRPLVLLLGAVGFVLLIACVNVSNLLLARSTTRRAEIAVRTALGATRWQIVRQMLIESVMLSLLGGGAALMLAAWGVRGLSLLLPEDLPRGESIAIDGVVLAFSFAVSVVAGLVFGAVPAVYSSRLDLSSYLKDARRDGGTAGGRRRVRGVLVSVEIALALVLLAGAGLVLRSFGRLTAVNPGFDPSNLLAVTMTIPEARYPDFGARARFYREYVDALGAQPGVVAAGAVMLPPLSSSGFVGTFTIVGRPPVDGVLQVRAATAGYLEALRVPLVRGRRLTPADREGTAPVAVITEAAARRFWPGEDPIGKRIRIHVGLGVREPQREIVGIVGDVSTKALDVAPAPAVYLPHGQYGAEFMTVFVRTAGDPAAEIPVVRAQLARLDPEVAVSRIQTGEALVAASVGQPRFRMRLLALFALVALLLAAVGVYGVMSFAVTQRRSELALRMALGAGRDRILRMVLVQGLVPVAIGIASGLVAAAGATRLLKGLLYETSSFDPLTFVVVALVLLGVGAAACYVPARRATSVDPLVSLRS
jgi:putative ABC transport system permease protein